MNQKFFPIILGVLTAGGLVMLALQWWIVGGIVTAIGLVLLFFWWKLYQITRISESIAKQDFETAKMQMASIKNPQKLNDYSKTYYFFFQGVIDTHENKFKEAESALKQALEVNKFRAPDDKASAHVMLGQLLFRKRNRVGGTRHLKEARSLSDNPQIVTQVKELAKQMRIRI